MYLGTAKKRNGSYKPTFSKKVKKNWSEWVELSFDETLYIRSLIDLKRQAETASNMPIKLEFLAKMNLLRDNAKIINISSLVYETSLDSTTF